GLLLRGSDSTGPVPRPLPCRTMNSRSGPRRAKRSSSLASSSPFLSRSSSSKAAWSSPICLRVSIVALPPYFASNWRDSLPDGSLVQVALVLRPAVDVVGDLLRLAGPEVERPAAIAAIVVAQLLQRDLAVPVAVELAHGSREGAAVERVGIEQDLRRRSLLGF